MGRFKLSYGRFGGTELRLLLAAANPLALAWPRLGFGLDVLLFDLLGAGASLALAATLAVSSVGVARQLARLEALS